ncbi:MAG: ABC transporter permease subunit [Deltaproteobacteria bacterium]|nr:ABC transporter permease subunit [Deltaproteobacteria bacterium]
MSAVAEIKWTCLRELRRNLRSAKGIAMSVLFLLGGGAASLIYAAIAEIALRKDIPAEAIREQRQKVWENVYDDLGIGQYLSHAPLFFVAMFKALWWLIPFLTLMIGFEQVCADLQHRSIRYDVVRARRWSIVTGKSIAIWLEVSALVLGLNVFVWIVTMIRGDASFAVTLSWGGRLWLLNVVYIATWAGLTVLMSSLTRRPILALFMGLVVFSGFALGDLSTWALTKAAAVDPTWWASKLAPARYAFPGFYQQWVVTPKAPEMISGIVILLAFGAASTAAACWVVNRSDV